MVVVVVLHGVVQTIVVVGEVQVTVVPFVVLQQLGVHCLSPLLSTRSKEGICLDPSSFFSSSATRFNLISSSLRLHTGQVTALVGHVGGQVGLHVQRENWLTGGHSVGQTEGQGIRQVGLLVVHLGGGFGQQTSHSFFFRFNDAVPLFARVSTSGFNAVS